MYKTASRNIGIFLTGFILMAWAAIVPASICSAGMHELSDGDMSAVYAQGFSSFTLDGNVVNINFNGITLSTWTEISSMKMGYYNNGTTTGWDNDWTNVSLGTQGTDLVAKGLYIKVGFSGDITNPATRQLDYVQIGTNSLTGTVTADFNSFSGTIGGTTVPNRSNLGVGLQTITSTGGGFYLSLDKNGGYTFNFGTGSHL